MKGKKPGRFSRRQKRTSSPWSVKRGSETRGILLPDSDSRVSVVCSSLSRTRDDLLVAGVGLHDRRPALELVGDVVRERLARLDSSRPLDAVGGLARLGELALHDLEALHAARRGGVLLGAGVEAADGLGDLGEVAHPLGGDHLADAGGVPHVDVGERALGHGQALPGELVAQVLVEGGDAVVVEGRGAGAEDRHVGGLLAEGLAVADHLAAHVAQGVLGAAALELVDRHGVGEVEHVDLLQLRRGTELGRHHVERGVDEGHDRGVALADAGGLDDHQVEAGGLHHVDDVGEVVGHLVGATGGQAAEEDPVAVEGVGADAVARAARRRPCGGSGRPRSRRCGACPAGRRGTGVRARR